MGGCRGVGGASFLPFAAELVSCFGFVEAAQATTRSIRRL